MGGAHLCVLIRPLYPQPYPNSSSLTMDIITTIRLSREMCGYVLVPMPIRTITYILIVGTGLVFPPFEVFSHTPPVTNVADCEQHCSGCANEVAADGRGELRGINFVNWSDATYGNYDLCECLFDNVPESWQSGSWGGTECQVYGVVVRIGGNEGTGPVNEDVTDTSNSNPIASYHCYKAAVVSEAPSESPSASSAPSSNPSESPSENPSETPSSMPSESPSENPSSEPSSEPSATPSCVPSAYPTQSPSAEFGKLVLLLWL